MFGKKQLERMSTRKVWNHTIDVKEEFVLRKGKVYPLSREERRSEGVREGTVEKRIHSAVQVITNSAGVLCRKKGWEEENGIGLQIFE